MLKTFGICNFALIVKAKTNDVIMYKEYFLSNLQVDLHIV